MSPLIHQLAESQGMVAKSLRIREETLTRKARRHNLATEAKNHVSPAELTLQTANGRYN